MTEDTKEGVIAQRPGVSTPGRALPGGLKGLSGWLRSAIFREAPAKPIGWQKVLAALAFVVIGAAVSIARTSGPGALNTIWIEDAGNFLQDGLHNSVMNTITTQMNGYYDLVPRIATAIAVAFPLKYAPGVMAAFAALQYSALGLIAYIASGPYLHSRWLRALAAAPCCVVPLAYTQVNNDLATVQFIALYGTFWLILWQPATRAGKITQPLIMLVVTLSSILPVVYLPLLVLRLIANRSKTTIAVVVFWAAGLMAQVSIQLRGMSNRPANWYTSPFWVMANYITRVVPRSIFGEKALGGPGTNAKGNAVPLHISSMLLHDSLIAGAWFIVLLAVVLAVLRLTSPNWPLAITAFIVSILVFESEIVDNLSIVQPRYVVAPALLLYTAVIALLRPRGAVPASGAGTVPVTGETAPQAGTAAVPAVRRPRAAAWIPVTVFAVLLAVVCGFNFRVVNGRSQSPAWSSVVTSAQAKCASTPGLLNYHYAPLHDWWWVNIPCSRVRS